MARFEAGESPVVDYYYFDGLGSTVMMTEGLSTITDRYDYDAWGNEYPIMASTADNPYRYVGQLGYYTHWQDPSLTDLLHLGLRFYEPGVGRFSQRDVFRRNDSSYRYASNRPASRIDPGGMTDREPPLDLVFPQLVADKGCDQFSDASFQISQAQKYVKYVVQELGLRCPETIRIKCYRKDRCGFGIGVFRKTNRVCGRGYLGKISVNWAPQCAAPYCIILEEMIHACPLIAGHKSMSALSIPGCGAPFGPVTMDPLKSYPGAVE